MREARILAALEHPGIVPVHDTGVTPDGRAFYVMTLVRGSGVAQAAAALSLPGRIALFLKVCDTVAFAHTHGVVHRDHAAGRHRRADRRLRDVRLRRGAGEPHHGLTTGQ